MQTLFSNDYLEVFPRTGTPNILEDEDWNPILVAPIQCEIITIESFLTNFSFSPRRIIQKIVEVLYYTCKLFKINL